MLDDKKQIAAVISDYIARERLSREQFAFRTKLGKSTVDKLFRGHFSDKTLSIVESQTQLSLRAMSGGSLRLPGDTAGKPPKATNLKPSASHPSPSCPSCTWAWILSRISSQTASPRISSRPSHVCAGCS